MADGPGTTDNALAVARDVLRRAPLIDGHNDLPWVIRIDRAARGDVVAYDLNRVHERADTDIPRLGEGMGGRSFGPRSSPPTRPIQHAPRWSRSISSAASRRPIPMCS